MNLLFQGIIFLISVLGLFIATFTDLKERIVPNKLTYSLAFIGILFHLIFSVMQNNFSFLINSVLALIFAFIFAWIFWKIGIWAGGDVKLFTALNALNPVNYFFLGSLLNFREKIFSVINFPVFFVSLFFFSLFAVFPYGFGVTLIGFMKRKDLQKELFKDFTLNALKRLIQLIELIILFKGISFVNSLINFKLFFNQFVFLFEFLIALFLLFLIAKLPRIMQLILVLIVFIATMLIQGLSVLSEFLFNAFSLFVLFTVLLTLIKFFSLSRKVLQKKIKITELKEGNISVESIVLKKSRAIVLNPLSFKEIFSIALKGDIKGLMNFFNPSGKILADSKSAAGITFEQLLELKKLVKNKRLKNEITIKLSVPFAPAILIAFIVLSLIGDLLWNVLFLRM